jgi:hypothetical protein
MLPSFTLWHFCDMYEASTGRVEILHMKAIDSTQVVLKYYMGNHLFRSGPKEISLDSLVATLVKHITIGVYVLH